MSPKRSFGRHIVFAPFLIKSPNEVWRLIVFKPFLIIIIIIIIPLLLLLAVNLTDQILRLMIRSLLSFTGRWIPISRGAIRSWNFQNGRRCHGNREHMSKSLTSLISEAAKGFPQDLAYILNRVCKIFWPTKIASEWPLFSKFQCSLISMKIYIHFSF